MSPVFVNLVSLVAEVLKPHFLQKGLLSPSRFSVELKDTRESAIVARGGKINISEVANSYFTNIACCSNAVFIRKAILC